MPPPAAPGPSYEVALVEARRTLDGQLAMVDAARTRALNLVALGGLLGTFFGGLGAIGNDQNMTVELWWAAGAFCVATVASLTMLWPYKFHSSLDPARITEAIPQRSEPEVDKWLAERIGQQYRDNAFKASWIQWMATAAVAAVGVEFFALALQLVQSG